MGSQIVDPMRGGDEKFFRLPAWELRDVLISSSDESGVVVRHRITSKSQRLNRDAIYIHSAVIRDPKYRLVPGRETLFEGDLYSRADVEPLFADVVAVIGPR